VPEAGAVVGHGIDQAGDVVGFGEVAEVTLVEAVEAEEVGGRSCGGGRAFVVPADHRDVVAKWDDGTALAVDVLDEDVLLRDLAR